MVNSINSINIVTDCHDDNARGRVMTRFAALFPRVHVGFVGVKSDIEAAGNLVDLMDANLGQRAIVFVNVAPRTKSGRHNGSPFGHVRLGKVDIVSTIEGNALSLLQKVVGELTVGVFDVSEVLKRLGIEYIDEQYLPASQFRSFEFAPRLIHGLIKGVSFKSADFPSKNIAPMPQAIWWQDNFGNLKTTFTPSEAGFCRGSYEYDKGMRWLINDKPFHFNCYESLKDIPHNEIGLVVGSSGYKKHRFLEIMKKGGSAAQALDLTSGETIKKDLN